MQKILLKLISLTTVIGIVFVMDASRNSAAACDRDAYMGTVCTTVANFCPRGTREANGALLKISQNTALFSLMGPRYGGDGKTTYALPDLRGMHKGKDSSKLLMCIVVEGTYPSRN